MASNLGSTPIYVEFVRFGSLYVSHLLRCLRKTLTHSSTLLGWPAKPVHTIHLVCPIHRLGHNDSSATARAIIGDRHALIWFIRCAFHGRGKTIPYAPGGHKRLMWPSGNDYRRSYRCSGAFLVQMGLFHRVVRGFALYHLGAPLPGQSKCKGYRSAST